MEPATDRERQSGRNSHSTILDETPIHQPPYCVSPREREIIRDQVKEMLTKGVIRENSSAFASPVVLVRKKNDQWRFGVDYRKLNKKIANDR